MSATDVAQVADDSSDESAPERVGTEPKPRALLTELRVRRITTMLAPALVFLGIRELSLLALTWMSAANHMVLSEKLHSWDGDWFLAIASGGYNGVPDTLRDAHGDRNGATPLAFFPGYPTAIRLVAGIDGPGGIGVLTAALIITIVSGIVCAYGLARLGRLVRGGSPQVGLILVALFAATPMSIVLSMAYSEALFCALAVWALIGVLERNWLLAGLCCSFAGLVRPTAAALILAVGLAALVAVIKHEDRWRPWLAIAIAPIGLLGYLGWVANETGDLNGWFALQRHGWDSSFDRGAATWRFVVDILVQPVYPLELVTVFMIAVSLVVVAVCVRQRLDWRLFVYGAAVLVMDLGSNGLPNSKVRLMVPAFTLLIPLAIALARRRTSTAVWTLTGLAVASAWFGAYALTSWTFAI